MTNICSKALLIRPYCDKDFADVARLEVDRVHEPYRSAVFVRQMAELSQNTFLVAVLDNAVVGFTVGTVIQQDPTRAWVLRMMVQEGYRHQGIGTSLLRAVTDALCRQGVGIIYLTVAPGNTYALRLYTSQGFEIDSLNPDYFGVNEDRYIMKKEINDAVRRVGK